MVVAAKVSWRLDAFKFLSIPAQPPTGSFTPRRQRRALDDTKNCLTAVTLCGDRNFAPGWWQIWCMRCTSCCSNKERLVAFRIFADPIDRLVADDRGGVCNRDTAMHTLECIRFTQHISASNQLKLSRLNAWPRTLLRLRASVCNFSSNRGHPAPRTRHVIVGGR